MVELTDSASRRTVLKLSGAALATAAGSGVVSANHEHPDVETTGSYQLAYDEFRLYGDLLDIGDSADYASVWFDWGPRGEGFPNTTYPQIMYSPDDFSDVVDGLSRGDYQFRAAASDSDEAFVFYGDTRYFSAGHKQ